MKSSVLTLMMVGVLRIWTESATPVMAQPAQLINQRQITLLEKARRPDDHWPRGDGHVLLGEPGGPLAQKAYHEPGGSFSPAPGAFGVSLWVKDSSGKVVATSDSVPMEQIRQRYRWREAAKLPAIENETTYYRATWSYVQPGQWRLELAPSDPHGAIEVVFRSVGPAGGPLESVIWTGSELLLNRRWRIFTDAAPLTVQVGDETTGELRKAPAKPAAAVISEQGWGFARLAVRGQAIAVTLVDTKPQYGSLLTHERVRAQFDIQVPDTRFTDSIHAQVATLMMGYIGRQTGPGEPINYPLAWERDGAYSLMAMARAGQLKTARELSAYFAENDFFGGFGAEGDAPGSATNALVEVAFLLNDPVYFEWLWPHIERKLGLVDEMMQAKTDLYKEFIGPVAPHLVREGKRRQLVCRAAQDGLIVGTMDLHFPVLYINAISYRGLMQGARLASQLGKHEQASVWQAKAEKLREAWRAAFGQPKYDNERNFMISVWPTWIIDRTFTPFAQQIEQRRQAEWSGGRPKERPLWTYFTAAEAHQWLFLGQPERTWETLEYFFAHQCAPGLYTYWEGHGEENTFKQWENYRGWLNPPYVTPHYWTAAEMLLLQLDMLVYVDESKPNFEIVIGGGVPAGWLKERIEIKNFRTKAGVVSWHYEAGKVSVRLTEARGSPQIRLGPALAGAGAKIEESGE